MSHEHMVDGRKLAQRVVDGQDRAAGIAEDGGRAFAGKGGPEDLGAGESGVGFVIHSEHAAVNVMNRCET